MVGSKKICFGAYVVDATGSDHSAEFANYAQSSLAGAGVAVARFDIVRDKQNLLSAVRSGEYDLLISYEDLKDDSVGAGTVREWKKENPNIRCILIVDAKKKGGKKVAALYKDDFYDVIFSSDFSGVNLKKLLENPRSREEAFVYYGIPAVEQEQVDSSTKAEGPAVCGDAFPEPEVDVDAELQKLKGIFSEDPFAGQADEVPDAQDTHGESAADVAPDVSGMAFFQQNAGTMTGGEEAAPDVSHMSFFAGAGSDAFTAGGAVPKAVPEEQRVSGNPAAEGNDTGVEKNLPARQDGMFDWGSRICGYVAELLDEHNLVIELKEGFDGIDANVLSLVLTVKSGARGKVEGGMYRPSTIILKAYGNCFLDENTLIVEVPDRDLYGIEHMITGRECTIMVRTL